MTDEEFLKITDSMTGKLGEEQSAAIADDLGLLITANTEVQKTLREKDAEIAKLKSDKEKLVSANANLLRQVPMGVDKPSFTPSKQESRTEEKSHFSFKDAFDEKGNFKR